MAYYEFGSDETLDEMMLAINKNLDCFLCGEKLEKSTVYWANGGEGILLHPKCARRLGQNFIFDSYASDREIQIRNWVNDKIGKDANGIL